jgi:type IV secretory pathway TrbL component
MIEKISYLIFGIWLLELFGTAYGRYLQTLFTDITVKFSLSSEFSYLFMSGIIYLISQIFKRGVELQEENELTV